MQPEASSSRPRKTLGEALEPEWAGFNNEEIDEEFPQSPVDDTAPVEGSSDAQPSSKGKEPDRGDVETTQKEIAQGGDSIKQPSGFFGLPYDVRNLIYLNLLRSDEPIEAGTGGDFHGDYAPDVEGHDLQPQFLQTSRQVHSECRDMLFEENVFQLTVWDLHENHDLDGRCNPCLSQVSIGRSRKFPLLKRIEIIIDSAFEMEELPSAILTTARVLTQQMSKLTHLTIKLEPDVEIEEPYEELEGLELIRNMKKAKVEGFTPKYAESLTKKLTTASPLPKMYFDLELFAGKSIDCAQKALRRTYIAALDSDYAAFVSRRAVVIELVKEHMKHVEQHLFDHDPDQAATEETEKCSESSGCQHCRQPRTDGLRTFS